jgi:hypothetical protein
MIMSGTRKSKKLHWEIMSQVEEAGEEDLCSLLNQVMGVQTYFGSGQDLSEYLAAVAALRAKGELCIRDYEVRNGHTIHGDVVDESATNWAGSFQFDDVERIWKWITQPRRLVEVPDS